MGVLVGASVGQVGKDVGELVGCSFDSDRGFRDINELVFIFTRLYKDDSHSNVNNKYIPLHHMFHLMLVQSHPMTSDKTAQTTDCKRYSSVRMYYMYTMSKD